MHSEHGRCGTGWRQLAPLIKIRFFGEDRGADSVPALSQAASSVDFSQSNRRYAIAASSSNCTFHGNLQKLADRDSKWLFRTNVRVFAAHAVAI